ncbi:hypothetical protein [Clostridium sp.]
MKNNRFSPVHTLKRQVIKELAFLMPIDDQNIEVAGSKNPAAPMLK